MIREIALQKREQMIRDGFCIICVLGQSMVGLF